MILWLAVETDEYELPLAVGDSRRELAEILGISENTLRAAIRRKSEGVMTGRKYIKVEVE